MKKIGILICANSGIDYEPVQYPFETIRSTLIIDGEEYLDYIDIKADEFYKILVENPNVNLSTAQTSTGIIAERLEHLKSQGYTDVIAIIISSKLSGTFQNVVLASEMVEGLNTYVVDTKSVSFGQLAQVHKAIELIESGHSAQEIYDELMVYRDKIEIFVLVDTLKFLVKNGRLSAASGVIGGLLKIKPLLHVDEEGSLVLFERIRTFNRARTKLIDIAKEQIDKGVRLLFLAYTNNLDVVEGIKDELLAYNSDITVKIYPLTPVVGAHAGPGTCGLGFIRNE